MAALTLRQTHLDKHAVKLLCNPQRVMYKSRQGQGVVLVEAIWDSFVRELLASIPVPGFDVQIGMVHILVHMKQFQIKCVTVTMKKNPNFNHLHI